MQQYKLCVDKEEKHSERGVFFFFFVIQCVQTAGAPYDTMKYVQKSIHLKKPANYWIKRKHTL